VRFVPPLVRLVWQTHRGYTATIVVLRLTRAFVPVATLWIGKLIIDAVVAARSGSAMAEAISANVYGYSRLWQLIALEV
jgi:ATP-binding cassette subfamily B protein